MRYIFKINVHTDGDFCLEFVPRGMSCDDDYDRYYLEREYSNKETAIKNILEICNFLKKYMHTSRDYVKKSWDNCIDDFIESIMTEDVDENYISEYISGNYDGTKFVFYAEEEIVNIGFRVTDEELEMIKNYPNKLTEEELKDCFLDLIKKKNEE